MHQIVAYGLAGTKDQGAEEKAAEQWTRDHGVQVLLWCREEAKVSRGKVEMRPQLHHVLFCLRAGDADWVVEAVLERMELKLALHARIAAAVTAAVTAAVASEGTPEGTESH